MFSPEQTLLLRRIVTEEITEALYRQKNHRSIIIYGLPEGDQKDQVNSILAHANISPEYISIRHRLGNPTLGKIRPLRVDLREGIPMPSLKDLARKLATDAASSSFHVRLLETRRQRKEGYEARQARRQDQQPVLLAPAVSSTATAQVLEFSSVQSINIYIPPVVTPSSPYNSIVDTSFPDVVTSSSNSNLNQLEPVPTCSDCEDEPDINPYPVGSWLYHACHIDYCIGRRNVGEMYNYFNRLPESLKAPVSDEVFRLNKFRLSVRPSGNRRY